MKIPRYNLVLLKFRQEQRATIDNTALILRRTNACAPRSAAVCWVQLQTAVVLFPCVVFQRGCVRLALLKTKNVSCLYVK